MQQGVVRMLNQGRGFGFVRANAEDYFFHMSDCVDDFFELQSGDKVSFEGKQTDRGMRATKIKLLNPKISEPA
jgi:cold shock CspA family protein